MAGGPAVAADVRALQQFLDGWIEQRGRYWAALSECARRAEDVGELGRELNLEFGDKRRAAKDAGGSVTDELGDVLFIVVLLANDLGIDLVEALGATLKKYEHRPQK